jgi:hypothetical protein
MDRSRGRTPRDRTGRVPAREILMAAAVSPDAPDRLQFHPLARRAEVP